MVRLELRKMSDIGNGVFLMGTNIVENMIVRQHPEDPNLYCSYRDSGERYKKVYCHYLIEGHDSPVIYHEVIVSETIDGCHSKVQSFKSQVLNTFK